MIEIRETTEKDLKNVQSLWAEGDVMQFVGFPNGLRQTDEEMHKWFRWIDSNRPDINHYSIFEDGVYCGESFYEIDREHGNSAALDIKLFGFARGRGIATKALSYAIDEAFSHGAENVWVDPNPCNAKAIALYERLGFRREKMPKHLMPEDGEPESIYMELRAEDRKMEYKAVPCEEDDEELIEGKIEAIDRSIVPPEKDIEEELVFKITDGEGNIIAGCILEIDCWKNADLDILWVDEKHRRKGLGSALIRKAEKTAREYCCRMMVLGTFDFQARPLYEKHGFSLCGTIRDWPRGHENYTLMKRLDQPVNEYYPTTDCSAEYRIESGTEEDAEFICNGLGDYNTLQAAREHKYIPLDKKIVDKDGNMIAAIIAGVGTWNNLGIDIIWVDGKYRNQGIGSKLLADAEREGKEKGAYFSVVNVFDWEAPLFTKHGYSPCVTVEDYPAEGHRTYELEKRF